MARKGRIKSSTGIYHTVLRGEKGLFFGENDYIEFLNIIKKYLEKTNSRLFAYSLEKNKIHLVFYTPGEIGVVMKPLLTSYARYINRVHKKTGKLFYDRYMSEPVENDDILKNAVIFVNEQRKASYTSKDEYLNKAELCDFLRFDKKSINEIKNPSVVYPFIDDYQSMTDSELKKYLLSIAIDNPSKNELSQIATQYSNLSMARVNKIFNLVKVNKIKKAESKPVEPIKQPEEPVRQKKQELSVWLL